MYRHYIKRILDILLALIGIIIAAIPMAFIALAIKLDSKGPVVFKQERIGKKTEGLHNHEIPFHAPECGTYGEWSLFG